MIETLSSHHIKRSVEFLSHLDKDWEDLIKKVGSCHLKISSQLSPYESLLKTIAYQQLNTKAAETIFQRFLSLFDGYFPNAHELIKTDPILIRESGFSQTKTETLLLIAEASLNKVIPDEKETTNESIINWDLHQKMMEKKYGKRKIETEFRFRR